MKFRIGREDSLKVLVLGAAGMAGHVISLYLLEQGHDVTTYTRRFFPYGTNIVGDVHNVDLLFSTIQNGSFEVIINCVGVLNRSCEEKMSEAVYCNSYLPHLLADRLKDTSSKIIHLSTDCVFSGKKGGYKENSFPDGQSFYDRTKALGELNDFKNLTFRNSIIGPDINTNGIGLFNWFMKQKGAINGYQNVIWTGVTTITLARAINFAISENITGIYHLVNNKRINKYELLCLFNQYFRNNTITINPYNEYKIDKSLINTRGDFKFAVPSYEEMICEMFEWIKNHKEIYTHYL